jgi:hypothetical protein
MGIQEREVMIVWCSKKFTKMITLNVLLKGLLEMSYVINNVEELFLICLLGRKVSKSRKGQGSHVEVN